MRVTCDAIGRALQRCGEPCEVEQEPDPDYVKSVARANALGASYAVEVHQDVATSKDDAGFGCYASDEGLHLSRAIGHIWYVEARLSQRAHQKRDDLYFLKHTAMPAIVWECGSVGQDPEEELVQYGEIIAHGIVDWLVQTKRAPWLVWVPPAASAPQLAGPSAADRIARMKALARQILEA